MKEKSHKIKEYLVCTIIAVLLSFTAETFFPAFVWEQAHAEAAGKLNFENALMWVKGKTKKLKLKGAKAVSYKSSNKKVVKVTKKGKLTPMSSGIASITVKDASGTSYTCEITVASERMKELSKNDITAFYRKLNEMKISTKDSMVEKIKKVHDWMVFNISYDGLWLCAISEKRPGYTKAQIEEAEKHQPASYEWVLENGLAVCQGYSETFKCFMDALDIDCIVISSLSMNHAWNMVKMDDGHWYHIDVTWDDPGWADQWEKGWYNTSHFLRNDEGISEDHNNWDEDAPKADGTYYEENLNHKINYRRSPKDEYWDNGIIKINYNPENENNYSEYDIDGYRISDNTVKSDGKINVNYFNKAGVIIKSVFNFDTGDTLTTEYDDTGLKVKEILNHTNGDEVVTEYDKSGRITSQNKTCSDGRTGVMEYNDDNQLIHEKFIYPDGRMASEKYVEYNSSGIRIKEKYIFENGEYWLTTYDDQGNEILKTYTFSNGDTVAM